ncbi:hypothetical protein [Kineococcus rhizosphaerae]|uniref:DUF1902 domain-containing protein n=1 Tax=Kineococcus rhizosphaerae TaxID=559628 RepID=A0A2T0QTL4_9ACTN|nr:hypothetical protein [Kineococcus rhizosphaerae]PRY08416.1 hypothetical protein CLV37_12411 [Kineococcus rhizosphaerae]
MTSTYRVRASKWRAYWELHIEDGHGVEVGVTQVEGVGVRLDLDLGAAEAMVRDFLTCDEVPAADTATIVIVTADAAPLP